MPGKVGAFIGGEEAERRGEQAADLFKVTRPCGAQERFQFGECQFDRIEVRTVGREETQLGARLLDGRPDLGLLVDREVVEDDDIAGSQGWHQHLFDIGEKTGTIDRPVEHGGRSHPLEAERGDHGVCLPVAAGRVIVEARAARAPTIAPDQIGRDAAFIQKDILSDIAERLLLAPAPTLSRDVRASLLLGVYRFF
jgi:hypothetical protein